MPDHSPRRTAPLRTFTSVAGATLRYRDVGDGPVVLALHGAYSTHHELCSALEPLLVPEAGCRWIAPDLTAMGDSPAHSSVASTDDLVDLLDELVEQLVGASPLAVVGHSYGGHLARAIAARRPQQVGGLTLICPLVPSARHPEPRAVVRSEPGVLDLVDPALRDEYRGYFVVRTARTAERFAAAVAPSIGRADAGSVARIMDAPEVDPDPDLTPFDHPTLIVAGRHDSATGYRGAMGLVESYPRATLAVLADAGHALPHEQPELLGALLSDWWSTVTTQ